MYVVYWKSCGFPEMKEFAASQLTAALSFVEKLRTGHRAGEIDATFVTLAAQDANSVGLPGVTAVENGELAPGVPYEWSKRHRGDGPRRD